MHRVAAALILVVAVGLAGCTASKHPDPASSPTSTAFAPVSSAAASASGPAPISTAVSTAPAGTDALPGVAAISGATDLAKQPGIAAGTEAPDVLVVRDLVVGTGAAVPALATMPATATVSVKYVGSLFASGAVFAASWGTSTNPTMFTLSGVIPGLARGVAGMKVGGRREIVVPSALGYGAHATTSIPAGSTLVFVVDLISYTG